MSTSATRADRRPGRPSTPLAQIVEGARRALTVNPRASMAQIAQEAGVGMSALYARFGSRQELLRFFADEVNEVYRRALLTATAELEDGTDPRQSLHTLMTSITESGPVLVLLQALGTFERSERDRSASRKLNAIANSLVDQCHRRGALRPGVTWLDIMKHIEIVASVNAADPRQTPLLRRRTLDVIVVGLTAGRVPLVGAAPTPRDIEPA